MTKFLVYEVISPSNKRYFGITSFSLDERKKEHLHRAKQGSMFAFHCAIRKYKELLEWRVHSEVDNWNEAKELEQLLIAGFNTCILVLGNKGYNGTFGGEGTLGYKHSNEVIEKAKISRKGKHYSPSTQFKKGSIPWIKGRGRQVHGTRNSYQRYKCRCQPCKQAKRDSR